MKNEALERYIDKMQSSAYDVKLDKNLIVKQMTQLQMEKLDNYQNNKIKDPLQ